MARRKKASQVSDDGDDENQMNYSSQRGNGGGGNDGDDFDHDMEADDNDDGEEEQPFEVFTGQTEAERRQIRRDQRALQKKLEETDNVDIEDARGTNNTIFKNVRFTREAVLDGDNLNLIATKASHKMDRMIQAPRYDADRVVDSLRKKLGQRGGFNWVKMGVEAGVCFNCIPSGVAFLSGPLQDGREEIKLKQRAKRAARRTEDEAVEEKPEDVQGHTERGVDHLTAHEKNVSVVVKTLQKENRKTYLESKESLKDQFGDEVPKKAMKKLKRHQGVCAVNLLYNPQSFTQTVENMFHFSYLVKHSMATFDVVKDDIEHDGTPIYKAGPRASHVSENERKIREHPPAKQAIVTMTMKDWRDMINAYDVEESSVPHRKGSKMRKTVRSGAGISTSQTEAEDSDEN